MSYLERIAKHSHTSIVPRLLSIVRVFLLQVLYHTCSFADRYGDRYGDFSLLIHGRFDTVLVQCQRKGRCTMCEARPWAPMSTAFGSLSHQLIMYVPYSASAFCFPNRDPWVL